MGHRRDEAEPPAGLLDAHVAGRAAGAIVELVEGVALGEARAHHRAPIFAFAPPGYEAATRQGLVESTADPDSFVLLAERDGAPAGYLSGFLLPDVPFWAPAALPIPCAYIGSAYVAPAARARGGLRALVAATARLAMERGARSLFTTYLPANLDAARAWQRLGFRPLLTVHQRRLDPRAVRQLRRTGHSPD
jgi:GNAT superfamily N-acetyltransferase